MHIDPWGLGLQAINFAVLAWLLHRFLYGPLLAVIDRRRGQVEQVFEEAKTARRTAEEHRRGFEFRIADIAREREKLLAEAREHIEVERREVLVHAETEADSLVANQREALDQERRQAEGELGERALALALSLSERLLMQVSGSAVTEALLDQVCARLAAEPAEQLRDRGELLLVATMPALDSAAQERWRQRLAGYFGAETVMEFLVDESLIAGVELRLPSLVIAFSWRDSLAEARAAMTANGP